MTFKQTKSKDLTKANTKRT